MNAIPEPTKDEIISNLMAQCDAVKEMYNEAATSNMQLRTAHKVVLRINGELNNQVAALKKEIEDLKIQIECNSAPIPE
jgi:hypothetical protein